MRNIVQKSLYSPMKKLTFLDVVCGRLEVSTNFANTWLVHLSSFSFLFFYFFNQPPIENASTCRLHDVCMHNMCVMIKVQKSNEKSQLPIALSHTSLLLTTGVTFHWHRSLCLIPTSSVYRSRANSAIVHKWQS